MSAANGSAVPPGGETMTDPKGKGKAVEQPHDMSMDEDEDTSEGEESGNEEPNVEAAEDADEDNMEEIDTSNILGRRTRGKNIDFAEAAQKAKEAGDTLEEDDDDDDDDFEGAEGEAEAGDRMEE